MKGICGGGPGVLRVARRGFGKLRVVLYSGFAGCTATAEFAGDMTTPCGERSGACGVRRPICGVANGRDLRVDCGMELDEGCGT